MGWDGREDGVLVEGGGGGGDGYKLREKKVEKLESEQRKSTESELMSST